MSQVNLLPPELRQKQATRRTTSLAVTGGVLALALVVGFSFLKSQELSRTQEALADQQLVNAHVQSQIVELQKFGQLQSELQAKEQLIATVLSNEVKWSAVLLDVARVIPANAYLTQMTGSIASSGGAGSPPTDVSNGLVGSLSFTGNVKGADTLAAWLTRLEQVNGWVNPWANSVTESGAFTRIYQFTSGVDLTRDAVSSRPRGEQP